MSRRLTLLTGDCLEHLRHLPDQSVQTVVTSPPYFGLRDYGIAGQLGLERTPEQYVEALMPVFREVFRVLKDDGTLWLNLGDSYAGSWGNQSRPEQAGKQRQKKADSFQTFKGYGDLSKRSNTGSWVNDHPVLKPKDLIGIPWRMAFALQADGWYLRQDIIWHKPNPTPESTGSEGRCTKAHEYIFLLTKKPAYYFDFKAIEEPAIYAGKRPDAKKGSFKGKGESLPGSLPFRAIRDTRRKRSVWTVNKPQFKGAHFATFPPDLIEPCILAGSKHDVVVLDPFSGAGTTGLVALNHGRRYVGIELNPEYVALTEERLAEFVTEEEIVA